MTYKNKKKERLLFIAMLISMVIWGMSWSSAKVLSSYGSASSLAFIRFFFVPAVLIPLTKVTKINTKINAKGIPYVLAAGLFMLCYTLVFFKGLQEGQPGKAGVLVTTSNPIFAYLIGLLVSRNLPNKKEIFGLLLGVFAGAILLNVYQDPKSVFESGNVYFLIGALVWAIMSKFSAQANRFGNSIGFSLWLNVVVVFGLLFIVDLKEIEHILLTGDRKFWLNIIYFGVINTSLATTCFLYASARIGAEKASTFIFIVPSMAIFGSWLFLNEMIEAHTIIGGLLGVIAVFVINSEKK